MTSQPAKIYPDFEAVKAVIDSARVVSFDFFDTLVARLVEKPWHAFFIVEKNVAERTGKKRPFTAQRRQAESIARQRAWKDRAKLEVTLDEIYDALVDLGFSKDEGALYKNEEIAVEYAVCYAEPANKELYDYAVAAGKKIILVSDIYLAPNVLEKIAANCGYAAHQKIFASSAYGETKAADGLFAVMLDALRAEGSINQASDVVHIGDNPHSDIRQAAKWGIKTLHRPQPAERFRQSGLKQWGLLDHFPHDACPLTRSLTVGLYTRAWLENGARPLEQLSLRDLGFYVVGPLLLGFATWMHQRCLSDKIDRLFFLARDGFIFKQAFDKIKNASITTTYVYASRRAIYLPSLTDMNGAANKFFVAAYRAAPVVREYFERMGLSIEPFKDKLIEVFGNLDAPLAGFDFRLGHFIRQYVFPNMREQIERERELATAYMAQMNMLDGTIALCDIGYAGSMQDGFARMARLAGHAAHFKGYYFATQDKHSYGTQDMTGWLFDALRPRENADQFYQGTALMELFFTSMHGTVLGYQRENGVIEPVLRPVDGDEEKRFAVARALQEGALRFIDMFVANASPHSMGLTSEFCLAPWSSFITNPVAPILELFAGIKHNEGTGISSYTDMIPGVPDWGEIISRPDCLVQAYGQSLWQAGYKMKLSPGKRRVLEYLLKHPVLAHKVETKLSKVRALLTFLRQT